MNVEITKKIISIVVRKVTMKDIIFLNVFLKFRMYSDKEFYMWHAITNSTFFSLFSLDIILVILNAKVFDGMENFIFKICRLYLIKILMI